MSESIKIDLFNEYDNCELVCRASVYNGSDLVKSWVLSNPDELIEQAVDAGHIEEIFEGVRLKKMLKKAIELLEITSITIKEKK